MVDCDELNRLIAEARKKCLNMTPEEQRAMLAKQAKSFVRAEFKIIDGVKVYASYEDYCND